MVHKNNSGKWFTLLAVPFLLTLALWQFYLFATFENAVGVVELQGGRGHLWVSIAAALLACTAGFLVLLEFLRYDRDKELHIT